MPTGVTRGRSRILPALAPIVAGALVAGGLTAVTSAIPAQAGPPTVYTPEPASHYAIVNSISLPPGSYGRPTDILVKDDSLWVSDDSVYPVPAHVYQLDPSTNTWVGTGVVGQTGAKFGRGMVLVDDTVFTNDVENWAISAFQKDQTGSPPSPVTAYVPGGLPPTALAGDQTRIFDAAEGNSSPSDDAIYSFDAQLNQITSATVPGVSKSLQLASRDDSLYAPTTQNPFSCAPDDSVWILDTTSLAVQGFKAAAPCPGSIGVTSQGRVFTGTYNSVASPSVRIADGATDDSWAVNTPNCSGLKTILTMAVSEDDTVFGGGTCFVVFAPGATTLTDYVDFGWDGISSDTVVGQMGVWDSASAHRGAVYAPMGSGLIDVLAPVSATLSVPDGAPCGFTATITLTGPDGVEIDDSTVASVTAGGDSVDDTANHDGTFSFTWDDWGYCQTYPTYYSSAPIVVTLNGGRSFTFPGNTLTLLANDGTDDSETQASFGPMDIQSNPFSRTGYNFDGWAATPTGAVVYADDSVFPFSTDDSLYAKWSPISSSHTVTFEANGGSGTMAAQSSDVAAPLTTNSFYRMGYAFSGWNTAANGSGDPYANGATYPFTQDDTLFAQWRRDPSPTPTPTPTPGPVPVPSPLPPGGSSLLVDGVPTAVDVSPNPGNNGLDITGDGWSMNLYGLGPDGKPLNLGPNESLILNNDCEVHTSGTGFQANSDVDLYLDPPVQPGSVDASSTASGIYVGTVRIDSSGNFSGRVTLPAGVDPGDHMLQATGYSPTGQVRAMTLGVTVQAWITLDQGTRTRAGRHDRISTTGDTGGLQAGTNLTVKVRLHNQGHYVTGAATITVQSDGHFTWTRLVKAHKTVTAYMSWQDVRSNFVTWRPAH